VTDNTYIRDSMKCSRSQLVHTWCKETPS